MVLTVIAAPTPAPPAPTAADPAMASNLESSFALTVKAPTDAIERFLARAKVSLVMVSVASEPATPTPELTAADAAIAWISLAFCPDTVTLPVPKFHAPPSNSAMLLLTIVLTEPAPPTPAPPPKLSATAPVNVRIRVASLDDTVAPFALPELPTILDSVVLVTVFTAADGETAAVPAADIATAMESIFASFSAVLESAPLSVKVLPLAPAFALLTMVFTEPAKPTPAVPRLTAAEPDRVSILAESLELIEPAPPVNELDAT